MAINCRNNPQEVLAALVFAHNALQAAGLTADGYHRDATVLTNEPLTTPGTVVLTAVAVSVVATDQPSLQALSDQILGVLNVHMSDAQAHLVADFANNPLNDGYNFQDGYVASNAVPALATTITNLNAAKALFNAHLTAVGVHTANDTVHTVVAADATDLASAETLANAMSTDINAHMSSVETPFCPRINVVNN